MHPCERYNVYSGLYAFYPMYVPHDDIEQALPRFVSVPLCHPARPATKHPVPGPGQRLLPYACCRFHLFTCSSLSLSLPFFC